MMVCCPAGLLAEELIGCPNNIHAIIFRIVRPKGHGDRAACVGRVWISIGRDISAVGRCTTSMSLLNWKSSSLTGAIKMSPAASELPATVNARAIGF